MAIVKQYHKETDTTYVYESSSYWDPEKKQSRSKRRLLGKLDPVTGEIVPTGKRGRKPAPKPPKPPEEQASPQAADNQYNLAEHKLVKQEVYIQELTQRISELEQQNTLLKSAMKKAAITLERTSNMLADISNK